MKFLIFFALLVVLAVASANVAEEEEISREKRALYYGARTFGIGAYPYAYGAHYGGLGGYYRGWY